MPRSSGTYSLPANTLAITGTTISSTYYNAFVNDVAAELTASLPRDGQAAMTGKLLGYTGSASAPSFAFSADATTGFFRKASGVIGISILGTEVATITAAGFVGPVVPLVPGAGTFTTITASSTIVGSSWITANQNFLSSTAFAVLGTTGAGQVYLRPNGVGSASGQAYVDSAGALVSSGSVIAGGYSYSAQTFASTSSNVVVAAGGGGVYLRPNGAESSSGEVVVDASGNITTGGRITCLPGYTGSSGFAMVSDANIGRWSFTFPNAFIETYVNGTNIGINYFISDLNRKEDVAPATQDILPLIEKIDFIDYRYKPYADEARQAAETGIPAATRRLERSGYAAQQLRELKPEWVDELSDGGLILNANLLLANAYKAIQELTAIVKAQGERITALEQRP